ncbi:MAG: outer membrane protein assembly factor BamD [Bacteroidales bacterium]|nr:outer membrane protein assembly factor BamD [Bacteroidales bacterium]
MFKNKLNLILISISVIALFQSCDFNRAKKIQNPSNKYARAMEYYDLGKYAKTQIMLEDVILSLRMTKEGEDALYKYADSYYHLKDYILAGYYFRKYVGDYPKGIKAENAQFMSAKCYYLDAPKSKLYQGATLTALQEFELFITKYPESDKIAECNNLVDELRDKLELKHFENAKLYYDIGYYNAAAIALKDNLKEYPDTKYKEEILYLIAMSKYKYAKNSIITKQEERYKEVISAYNKIISKYPKTKFLDELQMIKSFSEKKIRELNKKDKQS